MKYILETKELSKTYVVGKKNSQKVLKNVNLKIEEGEFVSIMGASGSGKSTLLYNASGMDKMTSGEVTFKGKALSLLSEQDLSKLRLTQMGFIFQQMHLLKNLSILDNIVLSAYMAKETSREAVNKRALDLMAQTGVADLAHKDITQVSGGQLQRVAICRALINHPHIIFGDEPTGALNSTSANEIMSLLGDINQKGTTIMLVTHDAKVASKTERVLFMLDGDIVAEKHLGKYDEAKQDGKKREEKLSEWLMGLGF